MTRDNVIVNAKVRMILAELCDLFDSYDVRSVVLANPNLKGHNAVEAGAERELIKSQILGCALRLKRAACGETVFDAHKISSVGKVTR